MFKFFLGWAITSVIIGVFNYILTEKEKRNIIKISSRVIVSIIFALVLILISMVVNNINGA